MIAQNSQVRGNQNETKQTKKQTNPSAPSWRKSFKAKHYDQGHTHKAISMLTTDILISAGHETSK